MSKTSDLVLTPAARASEIGDHAALVMATTGETLTYSEFEALSARIAGFLQGRGLQLKDHVSMLAGNDRASLPTSWAAQRVGLYWTPLNTRWTPDELEHVINDSGTKVVLVTESMVDLANALIERGNTTAEYWGVECAGGAVQEAELPALGTFVLTEREGRDMLYSSGTTGRPKGVKPGPAGRPIGEADGTTLAINQHYGVGKDSVFLVSTPLFHIAALASAMVSIRYGGTVVVLEKFSPEGFLAAVDRYKVTHTMTVPTIIGRVLELPTETRRRYDFSSMKFLGHGGAPCPPSLKDRAIDEFGPVLFDTWGATERPGLTMIASDEWRQKRGSVGRPIAGIPHIIGEDGTELPVGGVGLIYWEADELFEYHADPAKTQASRNEHGWATVGDIGYLDEDGYLYLTDRASHMIITGGENVYPAEIENTLVELDSVRDAAVIGRPHDDFGQQVVAFVEVADGFEPSDELAEQILKFLRERLAGYKCPRVIEFIDELPRNATGKLMKRLLS